MMQQSFNSNELKKKNQTDMQVNLISREFRMAANLDQIIMNDFENEIKRDTSRNDSLLLPSQHWVQNTKESLQINADRNIEKDSQKELMAVPSPIRPL